MALFGRRFLEDLPDDNDRPLFSRHWDEDLETPLIIEDLAKINEAKSLLKESLNFVSDKKLRRKIQKFLK
jgi:hypothetical protein